MQFEIQFFVFVSVFLFGIEKKKKIKLLQCFSFLQYICYNWVRNWMSAGHILEKVKPRQAGRFNSFPE